MLMVGVMKPGALTVEVMEPAIEVMTPGALTVEVMEPAIEVMKPGALTVEQAGTVWVQLDATLHPYVGAHIQDGTHPWCLKGAAARRKRLTSDEGLN